MRTGTILALFTLGCLAAAHADDGPPARVTVDNFKRAETDNYLAKFAKEGGFGKFSHERELARRSSPCGPVKKRLIEVRFVGSTSPSGGGTVNCIEHGHSMSSASRYDGRSVTYFNAKTILFKRSIGMLCSVRFVKMVKSKCRMPACVLVW